MAHKGLLAMGERPYQASLLPGRLPICIVRATSEPALRYEGPNRGQEAKYLLTCYSPLHLSVS